MADGVKVLLVEDDPEIGRIVRDHLRRQNYDVTWASSGAEGWEDFQAQPYAASIAAFKAKRLVWAAMVVISEIICPISSERRPNAFTMPAV